MKRKSPSQQNHNPKRRRPNAPTLDEVLLQGKTRLFRALKTARGFERQKLGRRSKLAHQQKNSEDTSRLSSEVAALKELSLEDLARDYLHKSLGKFKDLRESAALQEALSADGSKAPGEAASAAQANLKARLLNTKPVKTEIELVTLQICRALRIEPPASAVRSKKPASRSESSTIAETKGHEKPPPLQGQQSEKLGDAEIATDGDSEAELDSSVYRHLISSEHSDVERDDAGSEASFDSLALAAHQHRLADTPSRSNSPPASLPQAPSLSPSMSPQPTPAITATRTTFLPSLATGYISGSDSDISAENASLAPKRNRMGQRQRQALAERKYGTKAKHVLKKGLDRDAGWDRKRGAQDAAAGHRGRGRGRGGASRGATGRPSGARDASRGQTAPTQQSGPPKNRTKRDDDGPLHPSWEAKKRLKEQGAKQAEFKGTRVVFD